MRHSYTLSGFLLLIYTWPQRLTPSLASVSTSPSNYKLKIVVYNYLSKTRKQEAAVSARNFTRTFIWAFCELSRWIIMKSGGSEIKSNPFGFPSSFQIKTLNLSQCQQSHVSSLFPMMLPCVWGEGAAAGERGESGETSGDGGAVRVAVSTATLLDVLCQEVGTSSVNFWPDWTEFYNHT